MSDYNVNPLDSGYEVKRDKAERASATAPTKKIAESLAKQYAHNSGGGEVRFRNDKGQITDSDTVAPARDPFPPRDTKHLFCLISSQPSPD